MNRSEFDCIRQVARCRQLFEVMTLRTKRCDDPNGVGCDRLFAQKISECRHHKLAVHTINRGSSAADQFRGEFTGIDDGDQPSATGPAGQSVAVTEVVDAAEYALGYVKLFAQEDTAVGVFLLPDIEL